MPARLYVEGLLKLRMQLANLPATLVGQARPIVERNARGAYDEIRAAYPARTDSSDDPSKGLRAHLTMFDATARPGQVKYRVDNTAYYAAWFEYGTDTRQTTLGASRGKMPAGNVFYPRIRAWRKTMDDELGELLTANGFRLSGYVGE